MKNKFILFQYLSVFILILLNGIVVIFLMYFKESLFTSLLILTGLIIFLFSLYNHLSWSYRYGFVIYTALTIYAVWWQVFFKSKFLKLIENNSHLFLNLVALGNVILVTSFLILIVVGFYLQIKLKKVLKN